VPTRVSRRAVAGGEHPGRELFEQVAVNRETGTVEWPGEVDLDPEVLYGSLEPAWGTG
jgi:hypothetical protein